MQITSDGKQVFSLLAQDSEQGDSARITLEIAAPESDDSEQ